MSIEVAQKKLVVVQGKDRHAFDCSKIVDLYQLTQGKRFFSSADSKSRYLVVFVSGPSRSPMAAMNYLGAGTEGYLIWFKLDSTGRLHKEQSALIESCFQSAEGQYEVKGERLTATWDNYHLEKHFVLEYDSHMENRGFRIVETEITVGNEPACLAATTPFWRMTDGRYLY